MNESQRYGLILGILILIWIGILWACAGCQMMAGACRDIESAARYGHEHMSVDQ